MNSLRAPRRGAFLLISVAFSLAPAAPAAVAVTPPAGTLQIIHLDVGQGDGAVIITPGGQVAMFDCGGSISPSLPCSKVTDQLVALGITHADYHFTSHYHADHIGCFVPVDNVVHFGQGWDRGESYSSATYTSYASALGGRRHTVTKGQVWTLDSLQAHPVTLTCVDVRGAAYTSDENSKSIMLRLDYGNYHETFGGDLQGSSGGSGVDFESIYGPEVDTVVVYKVHHHGSRYSTNDNLLNAIAPKAAVISCGTGNSYGHPTADALNRLHNHGVHTYWTETGSGAAPNASWDKVANGPVTIWAAWQPGGKDVVFGGSGGSAFSDTLTNPGQAMPVAVDDRAGVPHPLRALANPAIASARFAVGVVGSPVSDLRIYSVDGREVRTVFRGVLAQGERQLAWDGRDAAGRRADSGVYFARFVSRGRVEMVKFLLVR